VTKARISDDKPGLLSPEKPQYSVFRWNAVACACGLVAVLDVKGRRPAWLMEHLYYFWGRGVKRKMSHPRKLIPGKHKIGPSGFWVSAVEATLNLRGPRIEIWASVEAKPTFGYLRETWSSKGCLVLRGCFWAAWFLGNPCRCQRLQDLDIIMSGFWLLRRCWVFGRG